MLVMPEVVTAEWFMHVYVLVCGNICVAMK